MRRNFRFPGNCCSFATQQNNNTTKQTHDTHTAPPNKSGTTALRAPTGPTNHTHPTRPARVLWKKKMKLSVPSHHFLFFTKESIEFLFFPTVYFFFFYGVPICSALFIVFEKRIQHVPAYKGDFCTNKNNTTKEKNEDTNNIIIFQFSVRFFKKTTTIILKLLQQF